MTEKEKQQAGELYNGNDRELVAERINAKKLCMEYTGMCGTVIAREEGTGARQPFIFRTCTAR